MQPADEGVVVDQYRHFGYPAVNGAGSGDQFHQRVGFDAFDRHPLGAGVIVVAGGGGVGVDGTEQGGT
ncbi:MAG: hypothetical protein ACR2LO_06360 [Ilumatobacteraceae bacterium]